MFHVKPGGKSLPCSIERHAGWASRRGDKRAEDSGHRMEIDAQSSIRQRDYVPRRCEFACDVAIRLCDGAVRGHRNASGLGCRPNAVV